MSRTVASGGWELRTQRKRRGWWLKEGGMMKLVLSG